MKNYLWIAAMVACSVFQIPARASDLANALEKADVDRVRQALEAGENPNGAQVREPFLYAMEVGAFSGYFGESVYAETGLVLVKLLVDHGLTLEKSFGTSLPLVSFLCAQPAAVQYVLSNGAPVANEAGISGAISCLHYATYHHDQFLTWMKTPELRAMKRAGKPLAGAEAAYRDAGLESMRLLLRAGADPNAMMTVERAGAKVKMPMALAAAAGGLSRASIELLAFGADPLARAANGETLLHMAAAGADRATLAATLRAARQAARDDKAFGEWINSRRSDGRTPLLEAAARGQTSIIALLVENGADISVTDGQGRTAQELLDEKIASDAQLEAESRAERQRQAEEAERQARQSELNKQAFVALFGAAVIGKATSGRSYTDAQRSALVDAWTRDRMNAANGTETNNFGSAAAGGRQQFNIAAIAAAANARKASRSTTAQEGQGSSSGAPSAQTRSQGQVAKAGSVAPVAASNQAATQRSASSFVPVLHKRVAQDSQLNANTVKGWCETTKAELKTDTEAAGDDLISVGACSCSNVSLSNALQAEYSCKFPYTVRQNRYHGEK